MATYTLTMATRGPMSARKDCGVARSIFTRPFWCTTAESRSSVTIYKPSETFTCVGVPPGRALTL